MSFKRLLFIICSLAVFASCANPLEKQARDRLTTMTETGYLSTTEFTVTKILKASDCTWWKIGERKILLSCRAFLEAGVDMSAYDASKTSINADGKSIRLTLPDVELLSVNMPADQIKVVYERVTGMRSDFSQEEKNNILRQGEADIRADIPNLGILSVAKTNTVSFFTSMLKEMGFEKIDIEFE